MYVGQAKAMYVGQAKALQCVLTPHPSLLVVTLVLLLGVNDHACCVCGHKLQGDYVCITIVPNIKIGACNVS